MPSRGISGLTAKPHLPTLFQIVSLVGLIPDLSQSSSDTSRDDPTASEIDGDRVCPTVESRYVLSHFHFLRMNHAYMRCSAGHNNHGSVDEPLDIEQF